jgi:hypothetical protein
MRPEYDFASMKGGVRAKYHTEYRKGTNVVLLEPDVAEAFPTEQAVNEALRVAFSVRRAPSDEFAACRIMHFSQPHRGVALDARKPASTRWLGLLGAAFP